MSQVVPEDLEEVGSIPGSGESPGEEHDNQLQYSCLENPMDMGAWRAIVRGVEKSQTWLSTNALRHNPETSVLILYILQISCHTRELTVRSY